MKVIRMSVGKKSDVGCMCVMRVFVYVVVVLCVRACLRVPVSGLCIEHVFSEYLCLCAYVWCTCVHVCVYLYL